MFMEKTITEGIYEYIVGENNKPTNQLCPVCKFPIGLMPGSRDAICHSCGFKDPCCE